MNLSKVVIAASGVAFLIGLALYQGRSGIPMAEEESMLTGTAVDATAEEVPTEGALVQREEMDSVQCRDGEGNAASNPAFSGECPDAPRDKPPLIEDPGN